MKNDDPHSTLAKIDRAVAAWENDEAFPPEPEDPAEAYYCDADFLTFIADLLRAEGI